ncbi:hypothetical protein JTE90_008110 [Oedothorax gibbosus]|uniref:Uncharacterized protein n=1 Tax=Oedothorax gibbosus TaxID=931172 RepID=A0AAV6UZX5_9ARAC|nr:hypothetical protein JTE90_008110 [Oedothorax gibbosus]
MVLNLMNYLNIQFIRDTYVHPNSVTIKKASMDRKSFFPDDPIIPSTVTKKEWLYAVAIDYDEVIEKLDEESNWGKWLLFHDHIEMSPSTGLTRHDNAWQYIMRLVENHSSKMTGLICAKCSTGWMGERAADPSSTFGVICCYTTDCFNKRLAKKAANSIRRVYKYPKNMFYKTDEDTRAKKYRHLGHRFVSIYKHTIENEMFERDPVVPFQWNRV